MLRKLVFAGLSLALLVSSAWAQETDPDRDISDEWAAEQAVRAERQDRLDELMMSMANEMAEIRATTDRTKRESLMAAHRENMREAMGLMRSMGGIHMREVMAEHTGPGMQHAHKGMHASQTHPEMSGEQRITDLENRMDMMHVMMESMMEANINH